MKLRWSIWIRCGGTIDFWQRLWRLLDSNRSSVNGFAFCTNPLRQWYKWSEGARGPLRSNSLPSPSLYPLDLCRLKDEKTRPILSCPQRNLTRLWDEDVRERWWRYCICVLPLRHNCGTVGVYKIQEGSRDQKNCQKERRFAFGCPGGVPFPGPFHWIDVTICILVVWFTPDLQLERNYLQVQAKVEA